MYSLARNIDFIKQPEAPHNNWQVLGKLGILMLQTYRNNGESYGKRDK